MDSSNSVRTEMVSKFNFRKFEAMVISLLFIFYFFNKYPSKELFAGNVEIGRDGVMMIIGFFLSLSAWYLNLQAESSLMFYTEHGCAFARQAAAQNFVLFFVVCAFGNSILPDNAIWRGVGGFVCVFLCYYFLFERSHINEAVEYLKSEGGAAAKEVAIPLSLPYMGCILVRWVGLGYGFYFLYKLIFKQ